jgi:cephalosporin-C deacetylase-like acetyl esterase
MNSNTYDNFSELTVEELQSYYSDFHKDYYGFRPHTGNADSWTDRSYLVFKINAIHRAIDTLKLTFSGREELRTQGWSVEETTPELIQQAEWLKQERELACEY